MYEGLQSQIIKKYAKKVFPKLAQLGGPNTLTLDLENIHGLYEICVNAVKKMNEQLKEAFAQNVTSRVSTKTTTRE